MGTTIQLTLLISVCIPNAIKYAYNYAINNVCGIKTFLISK